MSCHPSCVRPSTTQAHCGTCHVTFGGVYNFDRHRARGVCTPPAALGLLLTNGIWREPPSDRLRHHIGRVRPE